MHAIARSGRFAVLLAALTACGHSLAQSSAGPLIRPEGLRKISAHVHIIPDNGVPQVPNVGFVVGAKSVLVIDTGMGVRNGAKVAEVAKQLAGNRALYLVTTHFHPEHALGAQAFPAGTMVIRSADQQKDNDELGLQIAQAFALRSPLVAELLEGAEYRSANLSFGKDMRLDLGGLQVRMYAMGPNHTRGDIAIWIEADKVLFSGDIAMRAQPVFLAPYSSLSQWLGSLARLGALQPAIVVPSHGPTGGMEFIDGYRAYLTEVRDRTDAEKRAGRSADATVVAVSAAMAERYPDRGRLAGAIKAAYAEAR